MDVQVDGRNRARRKGGAGGMIGAVSVDRKVHQESAAPRWKSIYYGGGQRVWPLRRLSCRNAKLASPHLIAPVITFASTVGHDLQRPNACTAVPHWWRGDEVWLSGRVGLFTSGFARRSLRPARWLHSGPRAHNWTGSSRAPAGRCVPWCILRSAAEWPLDLVCGLAG
jgi:hypothetical protein